MYVSLRIESRHAKTILTHVALFRGSRIKGPRLRRRPVHPRRDPCPTRQLGVQLERPMLRGPRIRDLLPLHLPVRDTVCGPQRHHPPQLLHLPRERRHADRYNRQGEEHTSAGAVPRADICFQGCRAPVPRQPVRVLSRSQERGQVWTRQGALDRHWRDKW